MKHLFLIFVFSIASGILSGQENSVSLDRLHTYKLGQELFNKSLYGSARYTHHLYIHQIHPTTEDDFVNLRDDAGAMAAISALRADLMSGENELLTLIQQKYPDPVTTPAILELGSYYYNQKWYKKCTEMYAMVDLESLSEYDMSEASFKKGYAHFVSKEFAEAKKSLILTTGVNNDFYYPANYYYGLCEYFTNNFQAAVSSFEKVKNNQVYKSFVPYYITQIYFAQNQADKVISHGEQALKDTQLRNRKEIRQLIGQSYFKQKEYEKALPHLEFYEANTDKLTIEEFYQLGFTQYQLKKYQAAIKNFGELNLLENKLGQLVNYYLADCYYRTGDKLSARAAFKKVSQMDFEKSMQEEATFNYGKLSAESGFDREAINTLVKIDKNSKYHTESQNIINELLENTSDYASALQIIESLSTINDKLKVTYQTVALKYGMQQYNNGLYEDALVNLEKAGKYQLSRITAAQGAYWSGQIHHEKGDYKKSIATLNQYFKLADGITWMPDESAQASAFYTQGYNYLLQKDFKNAEKNFISALELFKQNASKIKNRDIAEKIWPDAMVRTGDCLFKDRKYKDAVGYYNQAIQKKHGSYVYAMYQRGMIEGLLGEPFEKILTMRDIKTAYPTSEYADDALMQLGDTYFDVENVDNAYNSYNELVTKYKVSALVNGAHLKLALIAYNKGDLNTAISHYKTIFNNNPSSKEAESAILGLQEIYINDLGKSEEYVAYVSSLPGYKISDGAADSLAYMVGVLRYNEGEYEKAIAGFSNYLDKYPSGGNRIKAMYYQAESYTLLKKYSDAFTGYERLVKLGKSEFYVPSLRKSALIAYNYTQAFDKAFYYYDLYYQNITDDDEKYKTALAALRSAFRITNSEAVKKYGSIVSTHPRASAEERSTANYYVGKTHYREHNFIQAKVAFTSASEKTDNNQAAESRYLIAEILYKEGKKQEAEDQCNTANEVNAAYPFWIAKSLLLLSDIYVDRSDLFNARAALEAVIENFPDDTELITTANDKLKIVEQLEKQKNRIKPTGTINSLLEMQSSGGN
jgi:tetratricopeptide (TPR) repeat protein